MHRRDYRRRVRSELPGTDSQSAPYESRPTGPATLISLAEASLAREVARAPNDPGAGMEQRVALSTVRSRLTRQHSGEEPAVPVVAVIGCTNSGKSTIVNLLTGGEAAGMNVRASFTRSLLAVVPSGQEAGFGSWLGSVLRGYRVGDADPDVADDQPRAADTIRIGRGAHSRFAVLDTPDFSTEAAAEYVRATIDAAMIGDAVLLVVSDESYADDRTLRLVRLLTSLGVHVAFVANKIGDDRELTRDISRALTAAGAVPLDDCRSLPRAPGGTPDARLAWLTTRYGDVFRRAVGSVAATQHSRRDKVTRAIAIGLAHRVDTVLAPLKGDAQLAADWEARCARCADTVMAGYRERLLDARVYAEFAHTLARLTLLLEAPIIGPVLRLTGQAVRLPFRLAASAVRSAAGVAKAKDSDTDAALRSLVDNAAGSMREFAHLHAQQGGEHARTLALNLTRATLSADLTRAVAAGIESRRGEIEREIEAAAASMYEELSRRPRVLAGLRAANIALGLGSAAAVVVSHGINWADAALAPLAAGVQQELLRRGLGAMVEKKKRQAHDSHARRVEEVIREVFRREAGVLLGECVRESDINAAREAMRRLASDIGVGTREGA